MVYKLECQKQRQVPKFRAGEHYEVMPGKDRILLPELAALGNLRHGWVWERRARPHVPVWSYSKLPRPTFSPEENARLLCVYMRPWTLNVNDATEQVPLLSSMGVLPATTAHTKVSTFEVEWERVLCAF